MLAEFLERDDHLCRLSEALLKASGGQGRIVAIAGEAGAGKTTLVDRFLADQAETVRIFVGACENLSTPEPLLPLHDIARASGWAFDLSRGQMAVFETVLQMLADPGKPALLVLEDLHWADAATLDLIRFLGRRIARVKALVLVTYRDDELGERAPLRDVLGEAPTGSVERITLETLSLLAVKALAEKAGRNGEELFALTGGNPFLVTEALAVEGDTTPETVRDATLARAARLPPEGRAILEAVSIFPRRADWGVIAALVDCGAETGLDACVERGMLSISGSALTFRHELARRAIEGALSPSRCRALHQMTIEVLKGMPWARPSEIAHHAELAGDIPALIESARRAGEDAAGAGAPREAAAHFATILRHREVLDPTRTLEALENHAEQSYLMGSPEVAVQSMSEAADRRRAAGDAVGLGRDLTRLTRYSWICGRRQDAERYISEAIAVLEQANAEGELAWAYSHLSQLDMLAAKPESAIHWGRRALELAERVGAKETVIHALANIGTAQLDLGGPDVSVELERSRELAHSHGLHDHVERASCNLTCSAYWRRDYDRMFACIDKGVSYAMERNLLHWEAYMRGWRAMALLDQGHWQAAEAESQNVNSWQGVPALFRSSALLALARLRVRRGDPDADMPLEAARKLITPLGELQRDVYIDMIEVERAWLVRSVVAVPATPHSNASVYADCEIVDQLSNLHLLAVERKLQWVVGETALWLHMMGVPMENAKMGQPFRDHCSGRWREAAQAWRAMGCPYEEALALGEGDEDAKRAALAIFDRLGAAPAAARLRRLMRAEGVRTIPRGPIAGTRNHPGGLTRRQAQILVFLGDGLTNPEIADRLCISPKTAEHHVSAIMARLEVTKRRDAPAAARRLGLLESAKN